MSDTSTTGLIHYGARLPYFKAGDTLTPLSAKAINRIVAVANAILNLHVNISSSTDVTTGTKPLPNSAKVTISDDGVTIDLYIKSSTQSASGGSSSYQEEWDSTAADDYVYGDIVRVSPENTISTVRGGGTLPGVYVCTQDGPGAGNIPKNPLQDGGETAYWQWLSTWPSLDTVCDASTGEEVITISDMQKKP